MPSKSSGAVQTLKHAEEFVGILDVEADAVVAHEDDRRSVLILFSDFDDGLITRPCELDSIREQVLKDLLDQSGIALHEG